MCKNVLVLLLVISLVSSSFSTGLVFADSASDVALLNEQGVEQMNLGNYEEANSYFDKALQIDPNNVTYLNNKGLAILGQLNYYEAFLIFKKVLEIMPDDPIALASYSFAKNVMYQYVDGVIDVMIQDSNGYLVGYFRTNQINMIFNDIAKKELDPYVITKKTFEGQDNKVILLKTTWVSEKETSITRTSLTPIDMVVPIIISKHLGYPIEKGDVITAYYQIFMPIE